MSIFGQFWKDQCPAAHSDCPTLYRDFFTLTTYVIEGRAVA